MMGILWWFIEPTLYLGAFYTVFGWGMNQRGIDYAAFLMCGLVSWKWFAASIQSSSSSITAHHHLISQMYCPKWIFPVVVIGANSLKFVILLIALVCLLPFMNFAPHFKWLWILPIALSQMIFIVGCGLSLAAITPLFPDIKLLINHGLIALMFISGLTFKLSDLSSPIREWMNYNPIAQSIQSFRSIFLHSTTPDLFAIELNVYLGLILIIFGSILIRRLDGTFAKISK
jgi:lipopolysaccharide transport system permease protein